MMNTSARFPVRSQLHRASNAANADSARRVAAVDDVVRRALTALAGEISNDWSGRRERELVSLFCFGYLVPRFEREPLADPTQIAIEVAVPQIVNQRIVSGKNVSKRKVCKDIVIWPRGRMTCWDESPANPLAIIEWKHNTRTASRYDLGWLIEFSKDTTDFVGYAVSTDGPAQNFRLSCSRVFNGKIEPKRPWIEV